LCTLLRRTHRCSFVLPVRDQFIQCSWFEHVAREDVRTDFVALFDYANGDFLAGLGRVLLQANRGGETCRACTDHDDVIFDLLACISL
jgi:hypothetical protein